jgi:hypothetical protein
MASDPEVPFEDLCKVHEVGPNGAPCPPHCHWYCSRTQQHLEDRITELEAALADAEEHRVKHLLELDAAHAWIVRAIGYLPSTLATEGDTP